MRTFGLMLAITDLRSSASRTRRGLATLALVLAGLPAVAGADSPALDTVSVTGSAGNLSGIMITARSGTSGQDPTGTVFLNVGGVIDSGGPVTCLTVTGPDQGAGRPGAPTTAVLNFQDVTFGVVTVEVTDNGGDGADLLAASPSARAPGDCSPYVSLPPAQPLAGRGVVFDAPTSPRSAADCQRDGWRLYGGRFRNQGQCVAFVRHQRT